MSVNGFLDAVPIYGFSILSGNCHNGASKSRIERILQGRAMLIRHQQARKAVWGSIQIRIKHLSSSPRSRWAVKCAVRLMRCELKRISLTSSPLGTARFTADF